MGTPEAYRGRLTARITAAYEDGLISQATFTHRLEWLLRARVLEPEALVGDLTLRPGRTSPRERTARLARHLRRALPGRAPLTVLALDWSGPPDELLVGREPGCDVVLDAPDVSRRHALLRFHDGRWAIRDLGSLNGTRVNGRPIGRCELRPGDEVTFAGTRLRVD